MGAWIEITLQALRPHDAQSSHPTMGAWIEIMRLKTKVYLFIVAPHDGCVD